MKSALYLLILVLIPHASKAVNNIETVEIVVGKDAAAPDNLDSFQLSDYKGKIVVLSVWYKTCVPCQEKNAKVNLLKDKYKEVTFLNFQLNNEEELETLFQKLSILQKGCTQNHLESGKKITGYYGKKAPIKLVLNPNGIIQFAGRNKARRVEKEIKKLVV
jgi:hypothetical protein